MDTYVSVAVLDNEFEAGLLDSILTEQEIPHMMRSFYDTAYDGVFQLQKGWGSVDAPEAYRAQITELIEGLRQEADSGTEDDIEA